MTQTHSPRTSLANGRLWGSRAQDWADIQEGQCRAAYEAALREAKRIAKPSGRIVVLTWGNPQGMEAAAIVGALKALLPPSPPGSPGPFALSDEMALRGFAKAAEHSSFEAVNAAHEGALAPFQQVDGSYRVRATFRWLLATH
jgi:hypothetical protein